MMGTPRCITSKTNIFGGPITCIVWFVLALWIWVNGNKSDNLKHIRFILFIWKLSCQIKWLTKKLPQWRSRVGRINELPLETGCLRTSIVKNAFYDCQIIQCNHVYDTLPQIEFSSLSSTEQRSDSDSNEPLLPVVALLLFPLFPSCCLDVTFVKPKICKPSTTTKIWANQPWELQMACPSLPHSNKCAATRTHEACIHTYHIPLIMEIGTIVEINLWRGWMSVPFKRVQ